MSSPSPTSPSGLSSTSTSTDVAPSPHALAGLDTTTSGSSIQTASDVPVRSEEAGITVANLHDILARILEQTNALWERQESTNRMLDELRQSISVPQNHCTEIDERLHRIQSLTETLVKETASRTGQSVQEFVQESSHSATDVGHSGPSDEQLLGSLRPQTHVSPEIQDPPTSSSSRLPGTVLRRDAMPIQTISTLSSYDQVPEPFNISPHLEPEHEIRQGTGQAAELTALPPEMNVHGEQPDTTTDEHIHNDGCEATITATVENTHTLGELENVTETRLTADQTQLVTMEWAVALGNRLADVTNLVQQYVDQWKEKNDLMERSFAERQSGEEGRDRRIHEIMGMTYWLVKEAGEARQREESRKANEGQPGIEILTNELHRQNREQREFLSALSDSWRADSNIRYEEMISAVRATASEQVPYNIRRYLDEFSKSLSIEVRLLLGEVGKLREERRSIQHELGYLLSMTSSHGPGGEFSPEWILPSSLFDSHEVTPLITDPPLPETPLRRSAWRPVRLRRAGRRLEPEPMLAPAFGDVPSWATWQPNLSLSPTPPFVESVPLPDLGSPGLFGPPSPRG